MSDFEKLFEFKTSRFGSIYSVKTTYSELFTLYKKHDLNWKFLYVSDSELNKYNAS